MGDFSQNGQIFSRFIALIHSLQSPGNVALGCFFQTGGKQLQVRLTIPWKHNVQIEYLALSVSALIHSVVSLKMGSISGDIIPCNIAVILTGRLTDHVLNCVQCSCRDAPAVKPSLLC